MDGAWKCVPVGHYPVIEEDVHYFHDDSQEYSFENSMRSHFDFNLGYYDKKQHELFKVFNSKSIRLSYE